MPCGKSRWYGCLWVTIFVFSTPSLCLRKRSKYIGMCEMFSSFSFYNGEDIGRNIVSTMWKVEMVWRPGGHHIRVFHTQFVSVERSKDTGVHAMFSCRRRRPKHYQRHPCGKSRWYGDPGVTIVVYTTHSLCLGNGVNILECLQCCSSFPF